LPRFVRRLHAALGHVPAGCQHSDCPRWDACQGALWLAADSPARSTSLRIRAGLRLGTGPGRQMGRPVIHLVLLGASTITRQEWFRCRWPAPHPAGAGIEASPASTARREMAHSVWASAGGVPGRGRCIDQRAGVGTEAALHPLRPRDVRPGMDQAATCRAVSRPSRSCRAGSEGCGRIVHRPGPHRWPPWRRGHAGRRRRCDPSRRHGPAQAARSRGWTSPGTRRCPRQLGRLLQGPHPRRKRI